jgi:hypothetical protein
MAFDLDGDWQETIRAGPVPDWTNEQIGRVRVARLSPLMNDLLHS